MALSLDHKPVLPVEMQRIHEGGGWVENCRVNGSLALSRALGDFKFKQNKKVKAERQIVTGKLFFFPNNKTFISNKKVLNIIFICKTADPDIVVNEITEDWEFILLASDGIWDVLSNDDVVKLVLRKMAKGQLPEQICEELMTECLSPDLLMTGTDNMTVVLICFLHKKSYDDLCKHARELVKDDEQNQTTDELNDKNSDIFRKVGHNEYRNVDLDNNTAVAVDVTTAEIVKVPNVNANENDDGDDDHIPRVEQHQDKSPGNDAGSSSAGSNNSNSKTSNKDSSGNGTASSNTDDSSIPINDKLNNGNTNSNNEVNEKDVKNGTGDKNESETHIVQESKKFKETNSETDAK